MSKDLHDIDELFRSGLEEYQEAPSAGLKENIDAALDKQDAEEYKKRFIIWKRTALLLLLLLSGFVLYESGIIKTGRGSHTSKKSTPAEESISANKNEAINKNKSTTINSNIEGSASENSVTLKKNVTEQLQIITTSEKHLTAGNTIVLQNNSRSDKQVNLLVQNINPLFSVVTSQPVKKSKNISEDNNDLQNPEHHISPLNKKISIANIAERHLKTISLLKPMAVNSSPLLLSNVSNSKNKNAFKPFWMITPFVSYDQAGYRLDSDEPSAITSIKFREANEPSFSAGLLLSRQVTKVFSLQSGIVYRNTAIGMKPQKTYAFKDPTGDVAYKYITSSGYAFFKPGFGPQPAIGDSLTTAEAKHTLENISVPLLVKYTVGNKKLTITPGVGIEANFITKANLEVDVEDAFNREIVVVRKLTGTKSFYWSFIADAEVKYKVNQKLSINLRPVYRTAISPITKNNVVETFPNSFGIGAGVTIKF